MLPWSARTRLLGRRQTKPHSPGVRATANRPIGNPIAGVQFDSRHGDELKLWALFERAGDENVSTRVTGTLDGPIEIDDNDLNEGVRIHRLHGTT